MSLTGTFTELRPRLKPYPGHFRRLVTSLLRNLARLLAVRLRAWLTGRKLIVIVPHPYSHAGTLPVQLSGKAEDLYWFRDGVLDFVYSSHLLEDYHDTEAVFREWLRVLKPLGNLIIFCPDEQVYRKRCDATGQPYNTHHVHGDFSLDFGKRILDRIGQTEVLHETPLTDIYSWELVCRKKPDAPAEVSR